ncbi:hypothetical protein GCM10009114_33580 [Aliiglaciecola litoralis]|uniref:Solute-binding protein family 3/N-terminal domain-containing protein n=2 Tax=Aliiglaciecola litoralis TaxID=582857 RepID=A0ABP3X235_9ALTE
MLNASFFVNAIATGNRYLSVLLLILLFSNGARSEQIKYIDPTDSVDKHGVYFVNVLKLALEKSKGQFGDYELEAVPVTMRQQRSFKSLESGLINLMWTVTSKQREQQAYAIKVPLLKGLIGHRVLVIRKTDAAIFAAIKSLQDLAKFTAVQGHDWPDSEILEHAGLRVEKIILHNSMYKLVTSGIVDYFPRSVLEVTEELERFENDNLIIEPNHLILYPSAIYFFVSHSNTLLANRLEVGLKIALEDGSFDREFYDFPGHKKALQNVSLKNRVVHRIDNPLMPDTLPLENKALWFNVQ